MHSSTWLALDQHEDSYVALKVLKGHSAYLSQHGLVWELDALKLVSSLSPSPHCSSGIHTSFVTPVYGGDIKSLREHHGRQNFVPLVKRILLHILRGIAHAHKCGVVHTDLKSDNFFFNTRMSTQDLQTLLASEPPRRHPPEASYDGTFQAAVSQPLPMPSMEDAMKLTYVVADFGSAQPITDHKTNDITSCALRPPEILIGGPWKEKVIWTFGCLVFELITGSSLFKYEAHPRLNLDKPEFLLYTMICYTGEDFEPSQLAASPLAGKFFDSTCNLKSYSKIFDFPFELSIRNHKVMDEADVLSTATFTRKCLRLDPVNRASAAELLVNPWFNGVEG
ncbi:kinase-like protein [Ramaria rubella]|nr:kinase-like protein [Ramaria rubella]